MAGVKSEVERCPLWLPSVGDEAVALERTERQCYALLGDRVIALVLAEAVIDGRLSITRANEIPTNAHLSELARDLGLPKTGARRNGKASRANTFEATVGLRYMQVGLDSLRSWLESELLP